MNWRHISVAYKNEIHFWNLEIFEPKRVKTTKTRLRLPLSSFQKTVDRSIADATVSNLKDEFEYSFNVISGLNEEKYGTILEEILDNRPRHLFKSLCWSNSDEILISTNENYIFKVNF